MDRSPTPYDKPETSVFLDPILALRVVRGVGNGWTDRDRSVEGKTQSQRRKPFTPIAVVSVSPRHFYFVLLRPSRRSWRHLVDGGQSGVGSMTLVSPPVPLPLDVEDRYSVPTVCERCSRVFVLVSFTIEVFTTSYEIPLQDPEEAS